MSEGTVSWFDTAAQLSRSVPKANKCILRLLDTVFVDENLKLHWFFTTGQSLSVAKKKESNTKPETVLERFEKFALANPRNADKHIAVLVNGNGFRQYLDHAKLQNLLNDNLKALTQANSFLQVYQRPHDDFMDKVLIQEYTVNNNEVVNQYKYKHISGPSAGNVEYINERDLHTSLLNDMIDFSNEISKYMYVNTSRIVVNMEVEYIVDEINHAWLSQLPCIQMVSSEGMEPPKRPTTTPSVDIQPEVSTSVTALPMVRSASRESARPVSKDNSRPASSTEVNESNSALYGCSIYNKDSNGFIGNYSADELPGLSAWIVGKANAGNDSIVWNIDMNAYNRSNDFSVEDPEASAMKKLRSKSKHVVKNKFVLLVNEAETLLLGRHSINSPDELQTAWRNVYDKYMFNAKKRIQTSGGKLSTDNSLEYDVVVCGNMYAIVQKLDSLIKSGFDFEELAPPTVSPTTRSRQMLEDEETLRRIDRAASANSHEVVEDGDASVDAGGRLSNKSLMDKKVDKSIRKKSNKKVLGSKDKSKSAKDAKSSWDSDMSTGNNDPKWNDDVIPTDLVDHKLKGDVYQAKAKSKDKSKKSAANPLSKNSMNAPPSFELMAKFAAEKEKQLLEKNDHMSKKEKKAKNSKADVMHSKPGKRPTMQQTEADDYVNEIFDEDPYSDHMNNYGMHMNGLAQPSVDSILTNGTAQYSQMNQNSQMYPPSGINSVYSAGYMMPNNGINAMPSVMSMSGTETEFMLRQTMNGEASQLSVYNDDLMSNKAGNGSDGRNSVVETLKQRVAALETQVSHLTTSNQERDNALDKSEAMRRKIQSEYENAKLTHKRQLKQLQEDCDNKILGIEEAHSKQMAEVIDSIRTTGDTDALLKKQLQSPSKKGVLGAGSSSPGMHQESQQSNKKIFEQVELLQNENKRLLESMVTERKAMKAEFNVKLNSTEREAKAEVSALKSFITELEDKLLLKDEELAGAVSKLQSQYKLGKQLDQARVDAVEQCNKVKADLRNVQQTVAASYKLESSQGLTVGVDADTAIRLNEAKSEAKVRQQANKVEFLKSQLAAEQSTNADIRKTMESNRLKLEELKEEFRLRMQEAEQTKRTAVEEAEMRVEAIYEERMLELTSLQAKLGLLQGQLQESQQDSTVARQREEQLKTNSAKSQAQISVLRAEIEMLRGQIEELREKASKDEAEEATKYAHDAMIRRLDNERQYLKSQLTSEITLKNELQTALQQNQQQLHDVQAQWKKDVETLKEVNTHDAYDSKQTEQRMQAVIIQLESEVTRLTGNNKDLKEGYSKLRDQLRVDSLTMENMRLLERKLYDDVEGFKEEINQLQEAAKDAENLSNQQKKAMKDGLLELEAKKNVEIDRLKEDISNLYKKNSELSNTLRSLKNDFSGEKNEINSRVHALRVFNSLKRWQMARVGMFFRIWSTNNTISTVASQYKGQVKEILSKTKDDYKESREKALSKLREELNNEYEKRVNLLHQDFENSTDNMLAQEEEKRNQALEELSNQYEETIFNKNKEWEERIEQICQDFNEQKQQLESKFQILIEDIKKRHEIETKVLEEQHKTKIIEAEDAMKKATIIEENEKFDLRVAAMEDLHQGHLVEHVNNQRSLVIRMKNECEVKVENAKKEKDKYYHDVVIKEIKRASDYTLEKRIEEDAAHELEALAKQKQEYIEIMDNYKNDVHEDSEKRIRILQSEWKNELEQIVKEKTESLTNTHKKKMEELMKSHEAERTRSVKLETTKWKQVIRDMEKRHELEITQAKDAGFGDRDLESKSEIHDLTSKYELKISLLNDEHAHYMALVEKDKQLVEANHESAMEQLKRDVAAATERDVKIQMELEWTRKMNDAIDSAMMEAAKNWQSKLTKEEERLEKFKADQQRAAMAIAAERNELRERVNNTDEMVNQMKSLMLSEKQQMLKDFDNEREQLESKFGKATKQALKDQAAEHAVALENLQASAMETAEVKVKANKQLMEEELQQHLKDLHEKNDKAISALENAINDLRNEKNNIASQLESTVTKLEDAEDALYDLQQATKKKDKEHSIATWRMTTGILRMRERFKAGLKEFEDESAHTLEKTKHRAQLKYNDLSLVTMRLTALITANEETRKKMHSTLVSYKSSDLITKKTHIKLYERELERLTSEKDSLEENRDALEDEVADLENNVKDLEEQIRDHNRNSTMQNGRVNVAHARKKRRLDSELERILDLIEQKRIQVAELDDRITEKVRQRDEKETDIVEIEKQLVQILIEQQKLVLTMTEENKNIEEKCKMIIQVVRLPYPPSNAPVMKDVLAWQSGMRKKTIEEEDEEENEGMQ